MPGPFFQGTTGSIKGLAEGLGKIGAGYFGHKKLEKQKQTDQEFLDYLSEQFGGGAEPAPPPFVAPGAPVMADMGMGMADAGPAPAQNTAQQGDFDLNSMVDGRKAAAKELLSSPENALALMVEAKKRGVSTDANSLLDFIAKMGQDAAAGEREGKKMEATAKRESDREVSRSTRQEALIRSRERMAGETNKTRMAAAGVAAGASKYRTDNAPSRRDPTPRDVTRMELPELESLLDGLDEDRSQLKAPSKASYDSYDKLDLMAYREDYDSYDEARAELDDTIRAVREAIRMKKKAPAGGERPGAPRSPGAAPIPSAGVPGRPRPDSPDQEIAAYLKANGKLVSPETIQITRQRLQGR